MSFSARLWRHIPEILLLVAVIGVQFYLCRWLLEWGRLRHSRALRVGLRILTTHLI